jgi:hypothetical protein
MGQMQPMGGAPMGQMGGQMGGPMGPMGMRPPVRQGTSHVVPVVVSAGLAVGVFCGLLFGLGTKREVEPSKASNGAKQSEESQIQTAPVTMGSKTPTPSGATTGSAAAPANAGSAAAGSDATANAGSAAAPAATPPKPGKLTIDIKPDTAAQIAKIFVDGRQLSGTTAEVAFDPGTKERTVKVVVQAAGYQEEQRDEKVKSEESTSLSIPLRPTKPAVTSTGTDDGSKASGASTGTGTGGKTGGGKTGTGKGSGNKGTGKGSGLIDI